MILMQHDFKNWSNSREESRQNMNIAFLAFLAALFMMKFTRPIHDFFAVRHNRAVVSLRRWRFSRGWRK